MTNEQALYFLQKLNMELPLGIHVEAGTDGCGPTEFFVFIKRGEVVLETYLIDCNLDLWWRYYA